MVEKQSCTIRFKNAIAVAVSNGMKFFVIGQNLTQNRKTASSSKNLDGVQYCCLTYAVPACKQRNSPQTRKGEILYSTKISNRQIGETKLIL